MAESSCRRTAICLTDNGIRLSGPVMVPERQHHQVLRMGQSQRFQQRPVDGEDRAVGHRQGETDLLLQGERVDIMRRCGHNLDRTLIVRALAIGVMDLTTTLLGSAP